MGLFTTLCEIQMCEIQMCEIQMCEIQMCKQKIHSTVSLCKYLYIVNNKK